MYLTQALLKAARATPKKTATICESRSWTFGQLAERVSRLAAGLRANGLKPGGRVSILAPNSDYYFETLLATFWAGGVANPLNTRLSQKELAYVLIDAAPSLVVADSQYRAIAQDIIRQEGIGAPMLLMGQSAATESLTSLEQLIDLHAPATETCRQGDDLALLLYTGGTTGFPKGVMLSHGNLHSAAIGQSAVGCGTRGERYLNVAPMFHVGNLQVMFNHYCAGRAQVFIERFTPKLFMAAVECYQVSDVMLVPTMIQMVVNHEAIDCHDLSSLRTIFYGAAPFTVPGLKYAMSKLPRCGFIQGYGMTEVCLVTLLPESSHQVTGEHVKRLASVGSLSAFAEIKVVSSEGRELPTGEVGEVLIRGPSVMRGYWNLPDLTQSAISDGWMRSGDAGYFDADGFLYLVDRIKDMIVTGGENVYSTEVETALSSHPAVLQCAVVGHPDDQWGEVVHAVVVLKPGVEVDAQGLIDHCKQQIAHYKAPRTIEFRDCMPLSAVGKVLKAELRVLMSAQN